MVFLSVFFPHAVASVDCFRSSSAFFSAYCSFGCPFLFLSPFSVCCLFLFYMVFVPVFPHPAPPAALRFWHASCCLLCCGFSFGGPSVVRVLLSLRFCYFYFVWFSPPPSFFFLVPRAASLPWCLSLLVLVVVFFGSFSVGSALLCCCGFMVVCFLSRSDLRFPSRRGLPLGRVRFASASVFSLFRVACLCWYPFCFCFRSVPLPCSHLEFSFVSCSPGGLRLFSLVLSLVHCWFFPEAFLVPTRSCSFHPSSGSSLMSFCCSSLRSLLPFSSQFFAASLRLLFSVRGSLYPFLGRSSSLPSPPLSLPASGSFSFGLRLVQLCTSLGGWVASWVVSLLFLFAPSFVHEVLLCFLSSFRISPFRLSLPWSVVSLHLVPSGFVLPLLFPDFSVGLFFYSLVYPLVWFASPLGVSFPCSFQVPRSSSSHFLSA